jgi:predicted transcriptional regulator
MNRTVVKRILKELAEKNFINNPREKKEFGGDYIYTWKKNDWKTINGEEEHFKADVEIL